MQEPRFVILLLVAYVFMATLPARVSAGESVQGILAEARRYQEKLESGDVTYTIERHRVALEKNPQFVEQTDETDLAHQPFHGFKTGKRKSGEAVQFLLETRQQKHLLVRRK